MNPPSLVRAATGIVVVERLEIADGIWSRFRGLQFRRELPAGCGLLLVPCGGVHTFFLRFALDVIFLDRQGCVLAAHPAVRPWRLVGPVRGAHATLELPANSARLETGTQLIARGDNLPRSLRFIQG